MPHHGEGPHVDDHDHPDHDLDHDHEHHDDAEDTGDRAGGWAGVPEALGMPETLDTDTDAVNQPSGPDYGADDRPPRDAPATEPR